MTLTAYMVSDHWPVCYLLLLEKYVNVVQSGEYRSYYECNG